MKSTFWMTAQETENELAKYGRAILAAPVFTIGQRVTAKAFTDCFGKAIPAVPNLTVTDVRRIETSHIPPYDLVTTVYRNGFTAVIASARFFESA